MKKRTIILSAIIAVSLLFASCGGSNDAIVDEYVKCAKELRNDPTNQECMEDYAKATEKLSAIEGELTEAQAMKIAQAGM